MNIIRISIGTDEVEAAIDKAGITSDFARHFARERARVWADDIRTNALRLINEQLMNAIERGLPT